MNARRIFYAALIALAVSAALALSLPAASKSAAAASEPVKASVAEQLQEEFAQVAASVKATVVNIDIAKPVEGVQRIGQGDWPDFAFPPDIQRFFDSPSPQNQPRRRGRAPSEPQEAPQMKGMGSGVIIDAKNGYVLTNNHVVDGATDIGVTLVDGKRYEATLVGADPRTDLAVLQIKAEGLQEIQWGDSDKLQVGHWVLAFGQPEGLEYTVTKGIVSAKGRVDLGIIGAPGGINAYEDFIQTDAAINPGNSGGPLTDIHGSLVGINSAIATHGAPQFAGIAFAIPSNLAHKITASLIENGEVVRGWVGIEIANMSDKDSFPPKDKERAAAYGDATGVYVAMVVPGQPAETAGIKDGDLLVTLNGKNVEDSRKLRLIVADMPVGSTIKAELLRLVDGKTEKVSVDIEIAKQPKNLADAQGEGGVVQTDIGLTVQTLTPAFAESFGYGEGEKGVVVTEVAPGSRAEKADIEPGDLITQITYKGGQTSVESADDFNAAVSKVPKSESFVVLRKRQGQTKFVKID